MSTNLRFYSRKNVRESFLSYCKEKTKQGDMNHKGRRRRGLEMTNSSENMMKRETVKTCSLHISPLTKQDVSETLLKKYDQEV